MSDYIDLQAQNYSFFGKECELSGNFKLTGPTAIQANLEGELTMEGADSPLSIEREGSIEGKVVCHDLQIHGHFQGEIHATGKVTILPSAIVRANINAQSLEIHSGAEVDMEGETLEAQESN